MYMLEHLEFQGTGVCPQYRWKQMVLCANRELLETIRGRQRRPEEWRVIAMGAIDIGQVIACRKKAA